MYQFDLDFGFFRNRLLRLVLAVEELGLDRKEYERRLGQTYFEGLDALSSFSTCAESGVVYVRERETWDKTVTMMQGPINVVTDEVEERDIEGHAMLRIRFRRVYRKSTSRYHNILKGFPHTD